MELALSLRPLPTLTRCAVCHDDEEVLSTGCSACGTRYHPDCRYQTGRCPTLGCEGEVVLATPVPVSNAWSLALALVYLAALVAGWLILRGAMANADSLLLP